jgi:hypothetical protein
MPEITLADGTVIDQTTGRPVGSGNTQVPTGYIAIPTSTDAVREVTRVRKRLADLPDAPEKMHPIALVCTYYMFGLDDWEIAHALGITELQVGNIKVTDAFTSLLKTLQGNLVEGQADDVREILSNGAHTAAAVMMNGLHSDNEQTAIVAAKDVLDRAGHRPSDVIEHRHRIDGGLTIEYVKRGDDADIPKIKVDMKELIQHG